MASLEESSCVRGCCKSSNIRLDIKKGQLILGGEIAQGAESIVYRGELTGVVVAAKKPRLQTSDDLNRFHHELQLISTLRHPSIAELVGARAHPPDYTFVFRLYDRGNLSDALHGSREWAPTGAQILAVATQLATALQFMHSHGVVHRDVKPANVLLDGEWGAHLTDFGLATHVKDLHQPSVATWKSIGKPTGGFHKRHMVGTLQYMAPEVLRKELHTEKSDVYSFAITVNELATGVVPYSDRTTDAQAHTVLEMNYSEQALTAAIATHGLRPILPSSSSAAPPGLADLLEQCWHADPKQRPTFDEIVSRLCSIEASVAASSCGLLTAGTATSAAEDSQVSIPEAGPGAAGGDEAAWRQRGAAATRAGHHNGGATTRRIVHSPADPVVYAPVISAGAFATRGARDKMEDRHFLVDFLGSTEGVRLFGVFDGHRGFEAAEYAASAIPEAVASRLETMGAGEALEAAFVETDAALRREVDASRGKRKGGGGGWHPGCTAIAAVLLRDRLTVANAGDCRAILCRNGEPIQLSKDHIASDPGERERVCEAGGFVEWRVDTWRVGPAALQVTRSIGDGDLKPAVTADPELTETLLNSADEFLVIASDGLWERMSNAEVVSLVHDTVKEPSMCAKRLATEAVARGGTDNVTVIVAYLRPVSTVERIY